ncbi:MAG: ATP-binding protein [Dehalococcoidia bacterium]|nr:ATP-binding protein [Dehalococcoidia bacterium]
MREATRRRTAEEVLRSSDFYLFYVLVSLLGICTLLYWFGELVDLAGWRNLRWGFFYSVHDTQRLFFLAPIIYGGYVYRVKGAIIATTFAFGIFLPRALFVSPFPDPMARMALFVVFAGVMGCLTGMVRNESERRKRLESVVKNERDKLLSILNNMEDGVFIVGPDYRIRLMNPAMEREFGHGIGSRCFECFHHLDQPCPGMCKLTSVTSGETERWEYTFPDGRIYEVVAAPFLDSDGTVCQLATYRNITQHRKAQAELVELSRLKSELLSNVSHELRSPLTSIKGITSTLLQKDLDLDVETRESLLSSVGEETDRLASLVTNLLNMSKLEAGVWKPDKEHCHISDIVEEALEPLKWVYKRHIFEVSLEPDLPQVYVDYGQMKQVLVNLIENAAAYSEEGTKIAIRAMQANNEIEVSVADWGSGISEEDLQRVFDKFYRGQQRRQRPGGTGLGLAICRAIVLNHGGRIWAESDLGRGSTFYFSLPLALPGSEAANDV